MTPSSKTSGKGGTSTIGQDASGAQRRASDKVEMVVDDDKLFDADEDDDNEEALLGD